MLVKGHVRNGRLVVDEPTDLPEGAEVDLAPLDDDDGFTAEEEEGIRKGLAQIARGETVLASDVFSRVNARLKSR